MAVAPVAVKMGPRNRRRLSGGVIGLGVFTAIVAAAFLLLRPPNHTGSASSTGSPQVAAAPTFVTDKIVYGMTKAQVLQRIGHATKTVGACWQYDENEKIRNGENFLNAQRVCFLSGIYSYDYSKIDGKWNYPTDSIKLPHSVG
jgi:hypothetical protein